MAEHRHDLGGQSAGVDRRDRPGVALEGPILLPPPVDAPRGSKVLGGQPHREHAPAGAGHDAGMEVDPLVHRLVVHVLDPRHHLDILGPGDDRAARLEDRLEPRSTQPVDRHAGRGEWQPGHQRHRPGDIAAELAALLGHPEEEILDRRGIDSAPLDGGSHGSGGQLVASDMTEQAALGVRPANCRAATGDDHRRLLGLTGKERGWHGLGEVGEREDEGVRR